MNGRQAGGAQFRGDAQRSGTVIVTAHFPVVAEKLALPARSSGLGTRNVTAGRTLLDVCRGNVDERDTMRLHAAVTTPIIAALELGGALAVKQTISITVFTGSTGFSTYCRAGVIDTLSSICKLQEIANKFL